MAKLFQLTVLLIKIFHPAWQVEQSECLASSGGDLFLWLSPLSGQNFPVCRQLCSLAVYCSIVCSLVSDAKPGFYPGILSWGGGGGGWSSRLVQKTIIDL